MASRKKRKPCDEGSHRFARLPRKLAMQRVPVGLSTANVIYACRDCSAIQIKGTGE